MFQAVGDLGPLQPRDREALSGPESQKFARFFVARDIDKASHRRSLEIRHGSMMKGAPDFDWHQVDPRRSGEGRAVLKTFGNPNESYRDYQSVQAAAKRDLSRCGTALDVSVRS